MRQTKPEPLSTALPQCLSFQTPLCKRRHRFNIMIDEVLPKLCAEQFWELIRRSPAEQFLATQQDIMSILMSEQKLFESFFKRFYLNHLQLHNWYILAKENQLELKKYVFTQLLAKTYRQYREIVKDQQVRHKFAKMNQILRGRDLPKDKKKESFHKIQVCNSIRQGKPSSNANSVCEEERQRQKQIQFQATLQQFSREDYHELFLKTFNACDGNKYIYYDFDKHMRGIEAQKNYNNFIRIKKHNRTHQSQTIKQQDLQSSQEREEERRGKGGKENSHSTYITQPYFHEGEERLQKMVYCNYSWNPIGSVDVNRPKRELHVLKRLPNVFKRVKNSQSTKQLLPRKKALL